MTAASEPLLSVILPTYNERENVSVLVPRVLDILRDVPCEVIVVDDSSPDGTTGPVVHDEACTGCGACEYYCPDGRSAIIVDPLIRRT